MTSEITASTPDDADPAVVALIGDTGAFCTGSLVGPRVVLTAAHCLATVTPRTTVFFGPDPASQGTTRHVIDARPHPEFAPSTFDNDVAMLLLDADAPPGAAPLELFAGPMDGSFVGRELRLVGYGKQAAGDLAPLRKRQGTTTIDHVYAADFDYHANPSQTCTGDSGGPAFAMVGGREVVVGVTSNGDPGCVTSADDARVDVHLASFIAPYLAATAVGAAGAGERCFYDDNCATGTCHFPADAPRIGYCAISCSSGAHCPDGMQCGDDDRCAYPLPSPGALGASCATASDCDTQICAVAEPGGERACSVSCYPNAVACPAGLECLPLEGDPMHHGCFDVADGGCGCAADGGGGGTLVLGALLVLLVDVRIRRRTSRTSR